jgi:hypothetical protein
MKYIDGWIINERPALYYELTSFFSIIKMKAHASQKRKEKSRIQPLTWSGLKSQHNFDNINKKMQKNGKEKI